jgi:hypothetical protein
MKNRRMQRGNWKSKTKEEQEDTMGYIESRRSKNNRRIQRGNRKSKTKEQVDTKG